MRERFAFATGREFVEAGRIHRIGERTSVGGETGWLVQCMDTGETVARTLADLQRAYWAEELTAHVPGMRLAEQRGLRRSRRRAHDDLTPGEKGREHGRAKFLKYVDEHLPPGARVIPVTDRATGKENSAFVTVLADAARHAGLGAVPSQATYYRWRALRASGDPHALAGGYSNCGNRRQVEPVVRRIVTDTFRIILDRAIAETKAGRFVRLRMNTIRVEVEEALGKARALNPTVEFTCPSRATLYSWWAERPAVKRDTIRLGVVRTRQAYRQTKGHERPANALDEVEFDETDTPIFVTDESGGFPLGRLNLAWTVDVACHAICGFYLGFEPPGDMAMMSVMRHTVLPKSYVADEFPNLKSRWLQYGIPRLVRVDRSKQALGRTAEELARSLETDWDWCDAMTPYFKPYVESMFRILNQALLEELPGFVLPAALRRPDYDPAKNGVIGVRALLYILHAWIMLYNDTPQPSLGGLSPNGRWLQTTVRVEPGLPDRGEDLRRLFGIVRQGRRLDHNGVVFEGLQYGGDALQAIRWRRGHTTAVTLKVDPSDLGNLWVRDDREGSWVRAVSLDPGHTVGRSLHQHQVIRKFERERFGTDGSRRLDAEAELRRIIADVLHDPPSIRLNKLVARFDGVGTQHLLASQNHDGRLGPATGPFAGRPLDPTRGPATEAAPLADGAPGARPSVETDTDDTCGRPSGQPVTKRQRRTFAGDRSLAPK